MICHGDETRNGTESLMRTDDPWCDTKIEGVKIVEAQVFGDSRGWFVEQYNAERYKAAGIDE